MNYYPVTSRQTDRQTDRQKAMHRLKPENKSSSIWLGLFLKGNFKRNIIRRDRSTKGHNSPGQDVGDRTLSPDQDVLSQMF